MPLLLPVPLLSVLRAGRAAIIPFSFKLFIYVWLCWVFLVAIVVCGLLTAVASLAAGHRLWGARASLLHGVWGLPGPGIEPGSPALAGGFLAAEPPGKPVLSLLGPHSTLGVVSPKV